MCLLIAGGAIGLAQVPAGDVLVGITSLDGTLVSFDPESGEILEVHVQVDAGKSFVGLAYDRHHGKLYGLSPDDRALTTLDTDTLQLANVVPIRMAGAPGLTEATSLAYDPATDTLYTAIGHWENHPEGPIWDELAKLDPWTGELTVIGRIDGLWLAGLAFSETERVLYALGVTGAGSWDSPEATQVIRIDPSTAASETVFVTPYHTMLGMALKEPATFYGWINGESHFFGRTDLPSLSITPLAGDDARGAIAAMLFRTFDLPPEPVEPSSSPVVFQFRGHVTEVSDPLGRLAGRMRAGQGFRGQIHYDAGMPFRRFPSGPIPNALSLQSGRLAYSGRGYAARIMNDRLDPADAGPTDEFRLRSETSSGVVISWTLIDRSGNAVHASDRLPEDFDLSRWQDNTLTVVRYDPCCREPIYRFAGRVDEVRKRAGPVSRDMPRQGRRDAD